MSAISSEHTALDFDIPFPDDHLEVRHGISMLPGFDVLEVRQHLRSSKDASDDGWIVLARFRSWIGLQDWRLARRDGAQTFPAGAAPVQSESPAQSRRVATTRTRLR